MRGRALVVSLVAWLVGCGGHTERTLKMRTALDAGDAAAAVTAVSEEMGVSSESALPADMGGDDALLVLDRASLQQSRGRFALSQRDFEAADKAIDLLDLAHGAADSIGEYVFSGSSGKYQAPPYEKLLVNTLNMLNYLERRDLGGARVEARRLSVMHRYYRDSLRETESRALALGSLLAGFTYEKSGNAAEAGRYYADARAIADLASLAPAPSGTGTGDAGETGETGEILFVVGYGRVPHKIPQRIPIGLALTYYANALAPHDVSAANELAAQGLVTWVNFPTLGPSQGAFATPSVRIDGGKAGPVRLEPAVDLDHEARVEWKRIEGKIIVSAITRLVARLAVGQGIQAAAGKDSLVGLIGSLAAQATLTAMDTPDTRSWETLPARVAVARVRLPVGRHRVELEARGFQRSQDVVVEKDGWAVISLMALR